MKYEHMTREVRERGRDGQAVVIVYHRNTDRAAILAEREQQAQRGRDVAASLRRDLLERRLERLKRR